MDLLSQIREGGILYIILLIAITMHEFGHAFAADKLGDPLPRMTGRVTVNPLAHMDLLGTVILPILTISFSIGSGFPMVFGWGKPVEMSLRDEKNKMKTDLISTAGGVGMNLVLALISALLVTVLAFAGLEDFAKVSALSVLINCVLFVINMIPVPPLDGSRFLKYAVNMSDETYMNISRWGILILIALINIPATAVVISGAVRLLASAFFLIPKIILG